MKINEEITSLSQEIMIDVTNNRLPLHSILLKASRLSLLVNTPKNVNTFKKWAKYAEENQYLIESFKDNLDAARDPDVSLSSANPNQHISPGFGNSLERSGIRNELKNKARYQAQYRTETFDFALNIYNKWRFGNISQSIFEKKRKSVEPTLRAIFPDINQRLNSIKQNLTSKNKEDWKNAVASCRTLLMDIADKLNPPTDKEDKGKYINRLKDFVSPIEKSKTKKKFTKNFIEELKNRIEYTSDLTQGSAHKDRPIKKDAEDIVLYTYLIIAELMELHNEKDKNNSSADENEKVILT